jgi:hypothetical protein
MKAKHRKNVVGRQKPQLLPVLLVVIEISLVLQAKT